MRREQQEEEKVYRDELRKVQELKTIYDQKERSIAQLKCYYEHLKKGESIERPEQDRVFKKVVHRLNQKLERVPTKLYIGYKKLKVKTIECSEQGAADPGAGVEEFLRLAWADYVATHHRTLWTWKLHKGTRRDTAPPHPTRRSNISNTMSRLNKSIS